MPRRGTTSTTCLKKSEEQVGGWGLEWREGPGLGLGGDGGVRGRGHGREDLHVVQHPLRDGALGGGGVVAVLRSEVAKKNQAGKKMGAAERGGCFPGVRCAVCSVSGGGRSGGERCCKG